METATEVSPMLILKKNSSDCAVKSVQAQTKKILCVI